MTKRERYLKALHNERVDELVWAPNFDYWLNVNQAEGTLPRQYIGMSRNDIVRAIGGTVWNRAGGLICLMDPSVTEKRWTEADAVIHQITTPLGKIHEVYRHTEGPHRAMALTEHFVKDLDTLEIMKYVVDATHYEPDHAATQQALDETGDDGIVLNTYFSMPFIQFAKVDAGYVNGFYLWADHRDKVDSLIDLYFQKFLEGYTILADGSADVIGNGDNMDGLMISPTIFNEYGVPFYREVQKICSERGKLCQGHWCGRTQSLLPLVPDCGLDIVEAIVTQPMASVTLSDALDMLDGKVVLQGGIPSVLVCEEGGSTDAFMRYIQDVILPLKGRKGFVLGMSDNVPPNADFSRIEMIAELVAGG